MTASILIIAMLAMSIGCGALAQDDNQAQASASAYSVGADVFSDVNGGDWYYSYVTYVLNKGIMTGMGDNNFSPASTLSRAQFATVLYRMDGKQDTAYTDRFPDVPDGQFYTEPVLWASSKDVMVIRGYEDGMFGSADEITREQMVTMMYRYGQYKGCQMDPGKELAEFPDAGNVTDFAKEAMQWAVGCGIIKGDQGLLNPQGNTSRAVCATIIQRFCETYLPGQIPDLDISASAGQITVSDIDKNAGTFRVTIAQVSGSPGIKSVQVPVWCNDDQSDIYWYTAERQPDGTYAFTGNVKNHGYHSGDYKFDVYVDLDIGIRLSAGSRKVVRLDSMLNEADARIKGHVGDVYSWAGADLSACYWWVVNNIHYKTLPIPIPDDWIPAGYTRTQWYAIMAFEQRQGNCYCYAAAFYFLAKGLGYDAEYIEGQVGMAAGGYGPHGWVIIHMDGASYICDPEAQYEIGGYNFYMQPIGSPVLNYRW